MKDSYCLENPTQHLFTWPHCAGNELEGERCIVILSVSLVDYKTHQSTQLAESQDLTTCQPNKLPTAGHVTLQPKPPSLNKAGIRGQLIAHKLTTTCTCMARLNLSNYRPMVSLWNAHTHTHTHTHTHAQLVFCDCPTNGLCVFDCPPPTPPPPPPAHHSTLLY